MTAGASRSARQIDPSSREVAEDLARRSGLTLNEWLARLMADEGPEDATSQDYFAQGGGRPGGARFDSAGNPIDEIGKVTQALERLSERIESAENRQALAIAGVERSVREVISRIDSAEHDQHHTAAQFQGAVEGVKNGQVELRAELTEKIEEVSKDHQQAAARLEGVVHRVHGEQAQLHERVRKVELEAEGPRSAEALRALEGALGKVAAHVYEGDRTAKEALSDIRARVERADQTGQATVGAIRELQGACSTLDSRLNQVEGGESEAIEKVAENLAARVEAAREELAERLAATAETRFDRVEQALAQMSEHVRTAEQRSAGALERMGREVLEVAQTLSRRVQGVEHRSAEAAERVGSDVARMASAVESRLLRADSVQAQALEKLGAEIARITERLADRIANAERRSAQAIDEVGEQVSRVTERVGQRHDRSVSELAERIHQSEERTARLLEEARQKIDARLAETQGRISAAQAGAAEMHAEEDPDAALFSAAPFPTYSTLTPAEQFFSGPAAASAYSPVLRQSWAEPPTFEDDDFEAAAEFDEPPTNEFSMEELTADAPTAEAPVPETPQEVETASDFGLAPVNEPGDEPTDEPAEAHSVAPDVDPIRIFAPLRPIEASRPTPPSVDLGFELAPLEPNVGFDMEEVFAPRATAPAPQSAELGELEADEEPHDEHAAYAAGEAEDADVFEPHFEHVAANFDHDVEPQSEEDFDAEPDDWMKAAVAEPQDPLTTREVIERARARARMGEKDRGARSKASGRPSDGGVLQNLAFGRARKRPGALTSALMVAGLLAAVSLAAGGFVVLEGQPGGKLPQRVADALAMVGGAHPAAGGGPAAGAPVPNAAPMAAMALSPKLDASGGADAATADMAAAYSTAVVKVSGDEAGGLADIRGLAARGYAPAQFFLSKLYEDGKAGLKKDPIEARGWVERAAEGGDRAAMHNLALDYFEGVGGPRDATVAAEWFRRAADLGLLDSQFNLAGLYEHGEGVAQNSAEAYKWYLIAARAGDPEARAGALRVRGALTPEARALAESTAAAFAPATPGASGQSVIAVANPDLVTAQRALNQLGYYQGPTDGVASPALRLAIAAYQRDQSLPVTGAPDSATIGKLATYAR